METRSRLAPEDVQAFLDLPHKLESFNPGDYLVEENARVESCIALLSGFIYRSKSAGSGGTQILGIHLRGDIVDLQNSLLDKADHNVRALTSVEVVRFPKEAIIALIGAFPALALAFWRDTLVDASLVREWTLNIGQRHARQRVAHLLCELALRQQAAGLCEGPKYEWPMTQEQVGNATGMTVIHANRMLRSLRLDGLIAQGTGRSIVIEDWQGLQAAGDFKRGYLHEVVS